MESATQPETPPRPPATAPPADEPRQPRRSRSTARSTARVIRDGRDRLARARSPRRSPACAPRSPPGRRSASPAARAGSSACATGSSPTRTGSTTLMQEETGKVRADAALEAFYCLDAINFWCEQGPKFLADEIVSPHNPLLQGQAGEDRLPAVRRRRDDQPLELPGDPLARRRDPGADGRQRGRDQALRDHAADR